MDFRKLKVRDLLTKNPKIGLYAVALLTLAYFFIFLLPEIKTLFSNLAQGTQLKLKIVHTKKDWANIGLDQKRISELREKVGSYEKRLPSEKEIPAVLSYLSDAAKELNVNITEIKPQEADGPSADQSLIYYKVPVLLKAESRYHQLGRFLNKLENADRFIKIGGIKIVASPHQKDTHYVQLSVITYVMK